MRRPSILFANDDILTQWVMTEVLSHSGYAVKSVCRCEDAVELLQDVPNFDLLLADLDLPDTSSGGLAGQWRHARPGRPAIFTSTQAWPLRRLDRHEHFLKQPFGARQLLELVEFALDEAAFQPVYAMAARSRQHVH